MILVLGCHDKTKTHFKGIILLHQLNIKLVASPEKERRRDEAITSVLWGFFSNQHSDGKKWTR